jgi:polyadenylate-binding protein
VAVSKLEKPEQAAAITNLLMSLSKRERAMCLFSNEILKQKVKEAKEIVDLEQEPEEQASITKAVPHQKPSISSSSNDPLTPVPVSPPVESSVDLTAKPSNGSVQTLASLAELPAIEALKLARDPSLASSLPLPKADTVVTQSTDAFIDSLQGQGSSQQKQAVGEKLFKFVKAAGGGRMSVSAHIIIYWTFLSFCRAKSQFNSSIKRICALSPT